MLKKVTPSLVSLVKEKDAKERDAMRKNMRGGKINPDGERFGPGSSTGSLSQVSRVAQA